MKLKTIPKLIAHRGASAYAPENTISAMIKAKELGAHWVEFDVQLTLDHQVVVIHDEELDRTTDSTGLVRDKTLSELKRLDAGSWFSDAFVEESVPSLVEVIQCAMEQGLLMNIELKPAPGLEKALIEQVDSDLMTHWPSGLEQPIISSGDWETLHLLREKGLEYPVSLVMSDWRKDWLEHAQALSCVSINVNEALLTQQRIDAIKAESYPVLAYTVNQATRAIELRHEGVAGFFTDRVDAIKALVN